MKKVLSQKILNFVSYVIISILLMNSSFLNGYSQQPEQEYTEGFSQADKIKVSDPDSQTLHQAEGDESEKKLTIQVSTSAALAVEVFNAVPGEAVELNQINYLNGGQSILVETKMADENGQCAFDNLVSGMAYAIYRYIDGVFSQSNEVYVYAKPAITIKGEKTVNLEVGDYYQDAGASAYDDEAGMGWPYEGDISDKIVVSGIPIDISKIGTNTITYNVKNESGVSAEQVTRTVIVSEAPKNRPTISLRGEKLVRLNIGDNYEETGAIASDEVDGDISDDIVVSGAIVDTTKAGIYNITYNVKNSNGLAAKEVTRNVIVSAKKDIAIGSNHALALLKDKTVIAWGENYHGQITVPYGLQDVIAIAGGEGHSLALKSDGTVVAWGNNSEKQATVPTDLTDVIEISANVAYSLALKSDGTVVAWGDDFSGVCDVPSDLDDVLQISAGAEHALALKSDGTVIAWGSNNEGVCDVPDDLTDVVEVVAGGNYSMALRVDGTVVVWCDDYIKAKNIPYGLTNVIAISGGYGNPVALKEDGRIVVWGDEQYSDLNIQNNITDVAVISASGSIFVALKSDGKIIAWGEGAEFSIRNTPDISKNPVEIKLNGKLVEEILTGDVYEDPGAIVIDKVTGEELEGLKIEGLPINSKVAGTYRITYSYDGEEGIARQVTRIVKVRLRRKVSTYANHNLLLESDGRVTVWGNNENGQTDVPEDLEDVVDVVAGRGYSLALKSDGKVIAWGKNDKGQTNVPEDLKDVIKLSAGSDFVLALKSDGTVVGWGNGDNGAIDIPEDLKDVEQVVASDDKGLALKSDGTVAAWAHGSYETVSIPEGVKDIVSITSLGDYYLALKSDGKVIMFGNIPSDYYKTVVESLENVVKLSGNFKFILALKSDQTVEALGNVPMEVGYITTVENVVDLSVGDEGAVILNEDGKVLTYQISGAIGGAPDNMNKSPRLTLNGEKTVTIRAGESYKDKGVRAIDIMQGNISSEVEVSGMPENTLKAGNYTVTYTLTDEYGIKQEVIRNIIITSDRKVVVGGKQVVMLETDGTVVTWGLAYEGQAVILDNLTGVIDVAAGNEHSLALKADGTVVAWGTKYNTGEYKVPDGLVDVIDISAGVDHCLALRSDGTVVSWGDNTSGQCEVPEDLTDVVAISAGFEYSLALKSNGRIVAWGNNADGQCDMVNYRDIVAISAGYTHSLALNSSGDVLATKDGYDDFPIGLEDVKEIHAGQRYSLVKQVDGKVVFWGIGKSKVESTETIEALEDAVQISAGGDCLVALRPDRTVVAAGYNNYGKCDIPSEYDRQVNIKLKGEKTVKLLIGEDYVDAGAIALDSTDGDITHKMIVTGLPTNTDEPGVHTITYDVTNEAGYNYKETRKVIVSKPTIKINGDKIVKHQEHIYYNDLGASAFGLEDVDMSDRIEVSGLPVDVKKRGIHKITYKIVNKKGSLIDEVTRAVVVLPSQPARISAGSYHSVLRSEKGVVTTWGDNSSGENGIEEVGEELVEVSSGISYSLGLKSDKTVIGFGDNAYGQLNIPQSLDNAVDLSAGDTHALALKADKTVVAWGNNNDGKSDVPDDLTDVIEISAGVNHSLALKADGTVVAWGNNDNGQCDIPDNLTDIVDVAAGEHYSLLLKSDQTVMIVGNDTTFKSDELASLSDVVEISAKGTFALVLKTDGSVVVLGNDDKGLDVPENLTNVIEISAGSNHALALKSDGTVVAWGDNTKGQSDVPDALSKQVIITLKGQKIVRVFVNDSYSDEGASAKDLLKGDISEQIEVTGLPIDTSKPGVYNIKYNIKYTYEAKADEVIRTVVVSPPATPSIYASNTKSILTNKDGQIITWGTDTGDDRDVEIELPPGVGEVIETASRGNHFLALRADKTVIGWGLNDKGQIDVPSQLAEVSAVSTGDEFSVAVYASEQYGIYGRVRAWGDNTYGQTKVPSDLRDVIAISTGSRHSLALKSDGTVVAWGDNTYGQADVPNDLKDVVAISAGSRHSLALKLDGSVVAWGANDVLQCAVPDALSKQVIIKLKGEKYIKLISGDNYTDAGAVATDLIYGDITDKIEVTGLPTNINEPGVYTIRYNVKNTDGVSAVEVTRIVEVLSLIREVSAGENYSLALREDGTIIGWGDNSSGQIDVPTDLSNVLHISAGGKHSLALKEDKTVVAWGLNDKGQTNVPEDLTDVIAISAGDKFSLALKLDGRIVSWGDNADGQGDIPEDLIDVIAISAGGRHALALKKEKTIVAWGANDKGQCDIPDRYNKDVKSIVAGGNHSIIRIPICQIIQSKGFGDNSDGQIKGGWSEYSDLMGAGSNHSIIIEDDISVLGDNVQQNIPFGLQDLEYVSKNIVKIDGGGAHSLALTKYGTIIAWGDNTYGQIDVPNEMNSPTILLNGNCGNWTQMDKDIDIQIKYGYGKLKVKWAKGKQSESYFKKEGNELENSYKLIGLECLESGWYTLYVQDQERNTKIIIFEVK